MTILPVGDLASSHSQKLHTNRLKAALGTLTDELASGQISDLRKATGGNFNVLASLEHQLGALDAYKTAASEASFYAGSLQSSLEAVQNSMDTLAPLLLEAGDSQAASWMTATSNDARARFVTVVSALNVNVADQTLLGGTNASGAALADAETMLGDLMTAIAAETTAAGVESVVDAWFDDVGGGFETSGYLGSMTSRAPFRIGPYETVTIDVTAADQRIRDVLKGYALGALVSEGALATDQTEQAELMVTAGERLLTANAGFSNLRGQIGSAEAAIEESQARSATEALALELARNDIVAADPYETAVDLEATQLQLEALFAITARLSRLSLTEYL